MLDDENAEDEKDDILDDLMDDLATAFSQSNLDDGDDEEAEEESDQPASELDDDEDIEVDDDASELPDTDDEEDGEEPAPEASAEEGDEEDEHDRLDLPALRKRLREEQKERKRLSNELEQSIKRQEASARFDAQSGLTPPDPLVVEAASYSTEDICAYLGRCEAGDSGTDVSFRAKALKLLEYKDATEVAAVVRKARSGGFGDISRDVEIVANESLSMVHAVQNERQREVQSQAAWARQNQECLNEVVNSDVAFTADGKLDLTNEVSVAYSDAGQELLSVLPALAKSANAPSLVLKYMQLKNQAKQAETVPALQARIAELEARIAKNGSSLPPGKPPPKRSTGKTAEQMFAEELASLGIGST